MNIEMFGRIYAAALGLYFVMSGLSPLFGIDAKLARIGLRADSDDGRVAFILIYCSLMAGIGVAMGAVYLASRSWHYPALIAITIISAFIVFRIVGASMLGHVSMTQLIFIAVELVEVAVGVWLLVSDDAPVLRSHPA